MTTDTQETEATPVFGTGGRIYRDSRPQTKQPEPQQDEQPDDTEPEQLKFNPEIPPWADQPEPLRRPGRVIKPSVMKTVQPPEPQPEPEPQPVKEPHDWRETISSLFELAGMGGLTATGFLITLWLGVLVASLCLLFIGVTISRKPVSSLSPVATARQPENAGG